MIKDLIKLIRPFNCLMAAIAVLIGYFLALGSFSFNFQVFLGMAVVFFICAGNQAINDYFDLAVDKKKRNYEKVLVKGTITPNFAFYYSLLLNIIGTIIAYFIGYYPFVIAALFSVLLFIYSAVLGKIKYVGNWVVGLGTGFTYIYGLAIANFSNFEFVLLIAISAVLANVARETVKDIEDIDVDKGLKTSLPMVIGVSKSVFVVFITSVISILLGFYVFSYGIFNIGYLALILVGSLIFAMAFFEAKSGNYAKSQSLFKKAMFVVLIGYIIGLLWERNFCKRF